MRARSKKTEETAWRLKSPRKFELHFFFWFFVLFGASWGASFGWAERMDDCCKSTLDKRSYTFIPLVISICLFLWTFYDIISKYNRVAGFVKILVEFRGLVDTVFDNASNPTHASGSVMVFTVTGGSEIVLEYADSMREVLLSLLSAVLLLLWENMEWDTGHTDTPRAIVLQVLNPETSGGASTQLVQKFDRAIEDPLNDETFACIMLDVMTERIKNMGMCASKQGPSFSAVQFVYNVDAVVRGIGALKGAVRLFPYEQNFKPWWWITLPIMFIGVVFPFLIPPAFYATMGKNILYIGPVIFVFITGPVLINIFLWDPFLHPSTAHMDTMIAAFDAIVSRSQYKYDLRFATQSLTSPLQNPPAGGGTTKQVAALAHQVEVMRDTLTGLTRVTKMGPDFFSAAVRKFMPQTRYYDAGHQK